MKSIESLHNKLDVVIKHLNIPLDEDGNPLPPPTETIEVHEPTSQASSSMHLFVSLKLFILPEWSLNTYFFILISNLGTTQQPIKENNISEEDDEDNDETEVLLEGFPPAYSIVQAAKEQQQQEFYALTLANRQSQALSQTSNDMKLLKAKQGTFTRDRVNFKGLPGESKNLSKYSIH